MKEQQNNQNLQISSQDLNSAIRGWDAEKGKASQSYMETYAAMGVTPDMIQRVNMGEFGAAPIIWAYKAALYDKLQSSKPQILKKATDAPKALKPGANQGNPKVAQNQELRAKLKKTGSSDIAAKLIENMI